MNQNNALTADTTYLPTATTEARFVGCVYGISHMPLGAPHGPLGAVVTWAGATRPLGPESPGGTHRI